MNVLVVQPRARPDPRGYSDWSSDVAMYVSALKAGGHEPSVLATKVYDERELQAACDACKPRLIVIHTVSRQADQARAIGAFYANALGQKAVVLFAGPHPSAWPADCMNVAKGIYALRGYAEHLLVPIADAIEATGDFFSTPGLSFPVLNRFYHNQVNGMPHIDTRPLPDRTVTNYVGMTAELRDAIGAEIDTSRGEYYASDRTQACFDMSQPRTGIVMPFQQRTVEQVLAEAATLGVLLPDLGFLGLRDEWCLANAVWVRELCSQWRERVGLPLWVASRPEFLTESVFEALADAGCFRIHLCLESGSERVRRSVLGRRVSNSHLLYVSRAARRFGMALIVMNELGFPGETEAMLRASIELNRRLHPDWTMCTVFRPEPGTALYQRAETKKWLTPSSYGVFYDPDIRVDQPWIRISKLDGYAKNFNQHVYASEPLKLARR